MPPKKMNAKAAAAAERKAAQQADKDQAKAAADERAAAADWSRGSNARRVGREADQLARDEEKRRRDAEKKAALAEDEAATGSIKTVAKKKKAKKGDVPEYMLAMQDAPKKTKFERQQAQRKKEKEQARKRQQAEEKAAAERAASRPQSDLATQDLLVENTNRQIADGDVEATTIDDAISGLTTGGAGGGGGPERHPERRQKAAYAAYEEREMARLQEEMPNLKRSQYKERIFASWKKSPDNPMNQDHASYNS